MKEERRTSKCDECGRDHQPMATATICYMCYRRHQRGKQRAEDSPYSDIHTSPISKDAQRVVGLYVKLLSVLRDLKVGDDPTREIIDIINPNLKAAHKWLRLPARIAAGEREQQAETVHAGSEEEVETATGEREQASRVHVHDVGDDADEAAFREREQVAYGHGHDEDELEVVSA